MWDPSLASHAILTALELAWLSLSKRNFRFDLGEFLLLASKGRKRTWPLRVHSNKIRVLSRETWERDHHLSPKRMLIHRCPLTRNSTHTWRSAMPYLLNAVTFTLNIVKIKLQKLISKQAILKEDNGY